MDSKGRDHPALAAVEAGTAGWALYRLLAWLSPAFPIGAFSYSHGLEAAVESGAVRDRASLQSWIAAIVTEGSGRIDADILRDAHRAASAGDLLVLTAVNQRGLAYRATAELALESRAQGEAFLATCRSSVAGLVSRRMGGDRSTSLLRRCGRCGYGARRHPARRRADRLPAGDGG